MKFILIIYFSFLLVSCKHDLDTKENSKKLECNIDIEFVSNYLNDISRIIAIQKSATDYPVDSFIRLEGMTRNEYDWDHLGYHYSTSMKSLDTLSQKITRWLEWLDNNKCNFTVEMANQVFERSNKLVAPPDFEDVEKLKTKQPNYQSLSDSMIIKLERQRFESGKLKFY